MFELRGNHYARECPTKRKVGTKLNLIQEATKVEDVSSNVPRIYVALDNQWAKYQSSIIEIEGMIADMPITILVDLVASFSYISSNMIMKCHLIRN